MRSCSALRLWQPRRPSRLRHPRSRCCTATRLRFLVEFQAAALRSATGIIRSEIGRLTGLKFTPTLEFVADMLPDNARRIEDLVATALKADEELARAREGAQWAGDPDPYKKPADDWDDEDEVTGDEDD